MESHWGEETQMREGSERRREWYWPEAEIDEQLVSGFGCHALLLDSLSFWIEFYRVWLDEKEDFGGIFGSVSGFYLSRWLESLCLAQIALWWAGVAERPTVNYSGVINQINKLTYYFIITDYSAVEKYFPSSWFSLQRHRNVLFAYILNHTLAFEVTGSVPDGCEKKWCHRELVFNFLHFALSAAKTNTTLSSVMWAWLCCLLTNCRSSVRRSLIYIQTVLVKITGCYRVTEAHRGCKTTKSQNMFADTNILCTSLLTHDDYDYVSLFLL